MSERCYRCEEWSALGLGDACPWCDSAPKLPDTPAPAPTGSPSRDDNGDVIYTTIGTSAKEPAAEVDVLYHATGDYVPKRAYDRLRTALEQIRGRPMGYETCKRIADEALKTE